MKSKPFKQREIYCPSNKFQDLRNDERLATLLTLARIINSMRFTQMAVIPVANESTASNKRQRMNSFLYLGALLYEGLKFTEKLGKHFKDLTSFREGFQQIQQDKEVKDLRKSFLDSLRNQVVFHYDGQLVTSNLQTIDFPEYVFAISHGETIGDRYYELADQIVVHSLIQPYKDQKEMERRFTELVKRTVNLSKRFGDAADKLIVEGLQVLGWQFRKIEKKGTVD